MSRLCSHFPSLYRFAAFMALLAMLVPMATMLLHHPAEAQSLWHICGIDQNKDTPSNNGKTHHAPTCPICQSLHMLGSGFVPPDSVVLAVVVAAHAEFVAGLPQLHIVFAAVPQARPRAPPSFA